MRCSHSRPIDERTRWATSATDLPLLKAPLPDRLTGATATVTSPSGPPDSRSSNCLASHTSYGTMWCFDSRLIDERPRWATSATDLRLLKNTTRYHSWRTVTV